jgi:serine/threonine protein kinase
LCKKDVERLGRRIGTGGFGEVLALRDSQTGNEFAVKMEVPSWKVRTEFDILKCLADVPGVPRAHFLKLDGSCGLLGMDLLGSSLLHLFEREACHLKPLPLPTVLIIADQVIARLESIHSRGIVHRDIKPDNMCIGQGSGADTVHIVDFGMAKHFLDPKTRKHIELEQRQSRDPLFSGTPFYASLNVHRGITASRRDDLESVGYMLALLLEGRLPWSKCKNSLEALECKEKEPLEAICPSEPVFVSYLEYCRNLGFDEKPDYDRIRRMFSDLLDEKCPQHDNRSMFGLTQLLGASRGVAIGGA